MKIKEIKYLDEEIQTDPSEYIKMQISFTPDEKGRMGRVCPSCEQYFKVKFGTGLPIAYQMCPYCGCKDESSKFFTQDQIKYAHGIIANEIIVPELEKLKKSLKSFKHFKLNITPTKFEVKQYQEKTLETDVICNNCGLDFSIYGVFSNCPDCGQLNAKVILDKSIEVLNKKLELYKDENLDLSLRNDFLKDALNGSVSAFDALGKALKTKYDHIIPSRPQNLFQNLDELNKFLYNALHQI
jgi:Zn finger protein HypA/HybF involved in hydrogenase expression